MAAEATLRLMAVRVPRHRSLLVSIYQAISHSFLVQCQTPMVNLHTTPSYMPPSTLLLSLPA